MTINTQRAVDRLIGVPLCIAAGMFIRMTGRHRPSTQPVRSICVMKFFGIGSIVLTAPFLAELRVRYPLARITYLTFASNAETPAFFPQVDRVLAISTASFPAFLRDTLLALKALRDEATDTVFDLEFFSKFSTLLSVLSGARRRSGFSLPTRWRQWNLTASAPLDRTDHVSTMFLRQLGAPGRPPGSEVMPPRITPRHADTVSCRAKLALPADGRPIIAINPNADETSLERRWSRERFAAVIDEIGRTNPEASIFLTGTSRERAYVEGIRLLCGVNVRNIAGELSLGEFVAFLELSTVVLTNDSGPVHLAAAVGTPVVALFGPETPDFYGPLDGSVTFYGRSECSPCLNVYAAKRFVCPYQARCMQTIGVGEVARTLKDILNEHQVHASAG